MALQDYLYRQDTLELRDALCDFFEEKYGKIRFLEEKTMGKVRADMLAVLPDALVGIEIKSHSDSYERLKTQVRGYDAFCDRSYLCIGDRHIHAEEHIPKYWGIVSMTVCNGVHFEILREAETNPKCKLKNQLSLLWHDELSAVSKSMGLPRYTSKSKKALCDILLAKGKEEQIKPLLCDRLFERDYTKYKK